ncbi:MAG TPA: phosphotransferase [Actinomycetota bacterium]|nr:phosphotransferase [Actinomycetota bacterium]
MDSAGGDGRATPRVVRLDEPVTPDLLTELLRRSAVLAEGSVIEVEATSNSAFNSVVVHLSLDYSGDAPVDAPRHLLLKRMQDGAGEREVDFYRVVARGERPLVRCWDAAFDSQDGSSHLLLEDKRFTHVPAVEREDLIAGRGVPPWPVLQGIAAGIGAFHARRWGDPRIGQHSPFEVRPWFADEASVEAHIDRRRRELDTFNGSSPSVPLYERALSALPAIWTRHLRDRVERRAALTLVHGDCYLTQWLAPRAPAEDPCLVDFDSVSAAPAAFDLAFLLTTFWTSEQRADHELRFLRAYHESLQSHGVQGYSWEDLLMDYRVMIAFVVFDAVFDHANGSSRGYWKPKMRCLTGAYQDWKCDEL